VIQVYATTAEIIHHQLPSQPRVIWASQAKTSTLMRHFIPRTHCACSPQIWSSC